MNHLPYFMLIPPFLLQLHNFTWWDLWELKCNPPQRFLRTLPWSELVCFKPGLLWKPGWLQDVCSRVWGMIYHFLWNQTISHFPWKHPNPTLLVKDHGHVGYQSSCQKFVHCLTTQDRTGEIPVEGGLLEGMGREAENTKLSWSNIITLF